MSKDVWVTGGTGFIGKHLIAALLPLGFNIYSICRINASATHRLANSAITHGDIEMLETHARTLECPPIAVIHLATEYGRTSGFPLDVQQTNVSMPLRLLKIATDCGVKRFINVDSFFSAPIFAYPHMRPYIISKQHFREWGEYVGAGLSLLHFINMRLEHVFGPADAPDKFISQISSALRQQQPEIKCSSGFQRRDFVFINDVINAFLLILNADLAKNGYTEYGVGTGISIPVKDFIQELKRQTGGTSHINFGALPTRFGEIMDSKADNTGLYDLGWRPQYDYISGISAMLLGDAKLI
jgi:nucleoside-diphosphate-sugar epimerase